MSTGPGAIVRESVMESGNTQWHGSTHQPLCRRRIAPGRTFPARRQSPDAGAVPGRPAVVSVEKPMEPDVAAVSGLRRGRDLDRRGDTTHATAPAVGTAVDRCRHYPRIGRAVYAAGRVAAEFACDQAALPLSRINRKQTRHPRPGKNPAPTKIGRAHV